MGCFLLDLVLEGYFLCEGVAARKPTFAIDAMVNLTRIISSHPESACSDDVQRMKQFKLTANNLDSVKLLTYLCNNRCPRCRW